MRKKLATNYKHFYEQAKYMLERYQNEIVPGFREQLEEKELLLRAAISDLHGHCPSCAHYTPNHNEGPCRFCLYEIARDKGVEVNDNWVWKHKKEAK